MTTQTIEIEKISKLIDQINGDTNLKDKIFKLISMSEYTRVFSNEIINALMVSKELIKGEINVVLLAPMQSGKSGTINQLCNLILKEIGFIKPTQGVVFVNSMTDKSLFNQNMVNLSNDSSIIKVMKMKDFKSYGFLYTKENNIRLIVRDEDQYGCGEESSFDTGFFEKLRLEDPEKPLVTVSATPFDVMDAMKKNCVEGKVISGLAGEGYFGIKQMLDLGLVRDLPSNYSHIVPNETGSNEISKEIQECVFHLKKFESSIGILRANKTEEACYLRDQLRSLEKTHNFNVIVIGSTKGCDEQISDGLEKIKEITRFQKKNTILIIMGALSAGKNLLSLKEKVKFVIETRRRQLANVVQGLPGRLCGYKENPDLIVYAKKPLLEKYVAFQENPEIFDSLEFRNGLKRDIKASSFSTQLKIEVDHIDDLFFPIESIKEYDVDSLYDKDTEKELSFLTEQSFNKILSFFNSYTSNDKLKGVRLLNNKNVNVRLASSYENKKRMSLNWNKKIGDNFKHIFPNKQKNNKYGILINNFPPNHPENGVSFCGIKVFTSGEEEKRTYKSSTKNTSMYTKNDNNNLNLE